MQRLQNFAWQSNQRGHNVHIQANPTAGEMLHREFTERKEDMKGSNKVSILEKYGGEQHLERLPKELLAGQTENCELVLGVLRSWMPRATADTSQTSNTRARGRCCVGGKRQRLNQSTKRIVSLVPGIKALLCVHR